MINVQDLEEAVWQFEQCHSLDAFKTLQESDTVDDEYIQGLKSSNARVCFIYAGAGKDGLNYLSRQLSDNPDVDFRERATVILGEIARIHPQFKEEAIRVLEQRSILEPERCIKGRIDYALQELRKQD